MKGALGLSTERCVEWLNRCIVYLIILKYVVIILKVIEHCNVNYTEIKMKTFKKKKNVKRTGRTKKGEGEEEGGGHLACGWPAFHSRAWQKSQVVNMLSLAHHKVLLVG